MTDLNPNLPFLFHNYLATLPNAEPEHLGSAAHSLTMFNGVLKIKVNIKRTLLDHVTEDGPKGDQIRQRMMILLWEKENILVEYRIEMAASWLHHSYGPPNQ